MVIFELQFLLEIQVNVKSHDIVFISHSFCISAGKLSYLLNLAMPREKILRN